MTGYIVRPLGRYGRSYMLNRQLYLVYRLYSIVVYLFIGIFSLDEFLPIFAKGIAVDCRRMLRCILQ
jgi:hypothetical protein